MTEASDPRQRQIIPASFAGKRRAPHAAHAAAWILAGSFMSTIAPLVGPYMMAYGVRELVELGRLKGLALATAECIALSVAAGLIDVSCAISVAVDAIVAIGIVWCMRDRRATVLGVTAVIALASIANLSVDGAMLAMAKESLVQRSPETLMSIARASVGSGIDEDMFLSSLAPVIQLLWPFIQYVMPAAIAAAAAGLGSQMMRVRLTGDTRLPRIAAINAPIWSVALLALSVVALLASVWAGPCAQLIKMCGATVAMSMRVIFAIQGFGVLFAQFERFRPGCLARTLLIVIAVWVEMPFFLFSIVGLIDVWANFRGLPRKGRSSSNAR